MARSLSSFKLLGASVFDGLYVSMSRRGHSAAPPPGAVTTGFGRAGMMGKVEGRDTMKGSMMETKVSSAWAPDPVTGYYRPENSGDEIDAVELREMLLNHRARPR
ncbi:Late embryoproteinsis abundant protein Lea5-D [Hibiscus syriacus]|uniref:Late embryoproteinsis abundant protein Lea5-D n=1 Tax=Hibiscus syriacus TaxID=106335 RepID=A0A6A2YWV0_HIBSY|nr:late embryogenesis abundant protein Lea5-D-like [Hibiscus syriacus]KAE8683505.1 Late embryoproteinsis abundant protein Lea5-D [Hibiscus syriacus]